MGFPLPLPGFAEPGPAPRVGADHQRTARLSLPAGQVLRWHVSTEPDGHLLVRIGVASGLSLAIVVADVHQLTELALALAEAERQAGEAWRVCDRCGERDVTVAVSPDGERAEHPDRRCC